tara:strand:+ start:429 stop:1037 length:609 start_codon:yes stop_codon:yes gene_type:complete
MKNYNILIIYLLIILIISFLLSINIQNVFDKIIFFWLIFDILIGIFEGLLFFKYDYIIFESKTEIQDNIITKDIPFKDSFNYHYWLELWKEYGLNCDPRYNEDKNLVHWIEIIHAVTSIPFIYFVYKYITNKFFTKVDGILMIIVSTIHIFGTIIYLLSLYYNIEKNKRIKLTNKYYIYKSSNYFWLLIPILLLVKGINIVK